MVGNALIFSTASLSRVCQTLYKRIVLQMKKFHFDLIILGKYFRQLNSFIDQSYHIPRKLANSCTGAQPSNRVKNDHLSVMRNFKKRGSGVHVQEVIFYRRARHSLHWKVIDPARSLWAIPKSQKNEGDASWAGAYYPNCSHLRMQIFFELIDMFHPSALASKWTNTTLKALT